MKYLKVRNKILFSILFIICLFLLKNSNSVKATTEPEYIWPIGGDNAYETYIDYEYYGAANQEPVKDGKSGREYIVNNELWPDEQDFYTPCENHYGMDITGKYGNTYKVVSVVEGTVLETSATYAHDGYIIGIDKNYQDRNQRRTAGGLDDGGGYGNYIIIEESSTGRCFLYAHLKGGSFKVSRGDKVSVGQEIATMGSSGDSGHMHLHFEIRKSRDVTISYWNDFTGAHRLKAKDSTTNLDPKDYIGSAPYIPAKRDKIKFMRFSQFRQINIYYDKPVIVETPPEVNVRIGDEIIKADYIGISNNNKKLIYRIRYDKFDILTSGMMYVSANGQVKDYEKQDINVDCIFDNVTIGQISECKVENTFSSISKERKGDVNGDGIVDARDATCILSLYSKISTNKTLTAQEQERINRADLNGDGIVDTRDSSYVLSYYTNMSVGGTEEKDIKAIKCDFNSDRKVNKEDYELLKLKLEAGIYDEKYDLNEDGILNNNDMEYFRNVILECGKRSI